MNWVWEHSSASGTELLVLLAIADCADDAGGNAFPSRQTLAKKVRLDPSTVRRVVRRLEDGGHVTIEPSAGRGRANVYTVRMEVPDPDEKPVDNSPQRGAICPGGGLPRGQNARKRGANCAVEGGRMPPHPSRTIQEPPLDTGTAASRPPPPPVAASDPSRSTVDAKPIDPVATAVLSRLGPSWHLSESERRKLAGVIVEKLVEGWPVTGLASYLSANPRGVVSAYAVLNTRLAELPAPRKAANGPVPKPEWCGECDETSRMRDVSDGSVMRCPLCHPLGKR